MGNEPDDQMSFVRLLLYSNELDLEAMIATTSTWQRNATHQETMRALIHPYGQVRSNLLQHPQDGPRPNILTSVSSLDSPDTEWHRPGKEKPRLGRRP
jgi:hypothetical protein